MNKQNILQTLKELGIFLSKDRDNEFEEIITNERIFNPWFTHQNVEFALNAWAKALEKNKLLHWHSQWKNNPHDNYREAIGSDTYRIKKNSPVRKIGIIMAGNIPMVGFHDLICVIVSGNIALVKLSSKDSKLIPYLVKKLIEIEPKIKNQIEFVDRLTGYDAVIATGSNNSARYFEYYFRNQPHIIRKNRTSVAILNGNETKKELEELSNDFFTYFGLGCRNISKLFVPNGYNFKNLMESFNCYSNVLNHNKYMNNYEYNKAIFLLNLIPHFDNGFILLKHDTSLFSPTAVLHYENYNKQEDVFKYLKNEKEKIQCIVKTSDNNESSILKGIPIYLPGTTQFPELWDYADQIKVMDFLNKL